MSSGWSVSMTLKPPRVPRPGVPARDFLRIRPYRPYRFPSSATLQILPFSTPPVIFARFYIFTFAKESFQEEQNNEVVPRVATCALVTTAPSNHQRKMNHDADDDRSSSTPTAASKSVSGQDKEKPRLTDQEKKNNHIASEQKRRAAIREGFDRLTELVPGLEGQGRSESIVLQKTVDFIHTQLQERQNLIAEIESRGGRVDQSLRPK